MSRLVTPQAFRFRLMQEFRRCATNGAAPWQTSFKLEFIDEFEHGTAKRYRPRSVCSCVKWKGVRTVVSLPRRKSGVWQGAREGLHFQAGAARRRGRRLLPSRRSNAQSWQAWRDGATRGNYYRATRRRKRSALRAAPGQRRSGPINAVRSWWRGHRGVCDGAQPVTRDADRSLPESTARVGQTSGIWPARRVQLGGPHRVDPRDPVQSRHGVGGG